MKLGRNAKPPAELCSLGISICLDTGPTIDVPDYLSHYNVVEKIPEEYMKIADQLLLHDID